MFAMLLIITAITFCGTATAEEQNIQDNSIVDTSITTSSTQDTIQDSQSGPNPQTAVNDQDTNNETAQNNQNTTSNNLANTSYGANEEPKVVITFDDGYESAYTIAYPIMEQYGIKGTVYVTPAWIGAPGYLTLQELTILHNAGWTIANHSWNHLLLPELPREAVTNEIQTTIDWLNSNGFADGAYHLAYPYGGYNNSVLEVCSELGIKTARTVNWGIISNDNIDNLQLPIILIRNDVTRNFWQPELDKSIAQKGTAIFLFHNIVTGNPIILEDITVAAFNEIIEYINQTGVKTETISEWYNAMNNPAPVANFTATPTNGTAPLTVQFTDQSTGSPTSWAWDFNNDGIVDSTAQNPIYTYSTAGTYTVKLTVTNSAGSNSLTSTNCITVNVPAPVANFTAAPTSGTVPLQIQFTDQSTGNINSYAWDFNNDGTVDSTVQSPSYIYSAHGTYTVKLTVTGPGGSNSITRTNYITVNPDTTAPTVTANPAGGTYSSGQNVVLTPSEKASIYYTTDGSEPTKSSNLYSGQISISESTTLKFKAWDSANNYSDIYTEIYSIIPADLSIETVTPSGNTATGITNYPVSSKIKNNGGTITKTFYVSYYLSTDQYKSSNDRYIGHATINGLNSGESIDAQILGLIPKDLAQGNYYIIAVADVTGLVAESNEHNNVKASASKIFVWRPDLSVQTVTTPGNTATGITNYTVSSTIKNGGSITTDTFYVSYYLSTDTTKSSNDRYIGHATVNGLNGWSTTTATAKCTIPKDLAQGNYYIIAVADVTGLVAESNEHNNWVSSTRIYVSKT